ncbi:hypothetical protein BDQ17DRAFT_1354965 [Cyathus striatus]|nr:hypothetical protein BDQ17DRAFT_1354965 [Cyathus striatus]
MTAAAERPYTRTTFIPFPPSIQTYPNHATVPSSLPHHSRTRPYTPPPESPVYAPFPPCHLLAFKGRELLVLVHFFHEFHRPSSIVEFDIRHESRQ